MEHALMGVRKISTAGQPDCDTTCPAFALMDAMLSRYVHWREHAATVADAYTEWCGAPADEKGSRFAAYVAALDREEASAATYATAVADAERPLHHSRSA
jgi:hypothetical protein